MLKINQQQILAVERDRVAAFARRTARFLHEQLPDSRTTPLDILAREIEPLISRARSYGMESEQSIAVYVLAAAHLGVDFDTALPSAAAILRNASESEDEKAEKIELLTVAVIDRLARSEP